MENLNTHQAPQFLETAVIGSSFMEKDELIMIIQAISTCIARKKQKANRRQRILEDLQAKNQTGLHQLKRTMHKGLREIEDFEKLKTKLETDFETD